MILVEYEETAKRTEEIKKKNLAKVKDLENKIKNAKQLREKELKDAEQGVTNAKKKMEESSKIMKQKSQVNYVKIKQLRKPFRFIQTHILYEMITKSRSFSYRVTIFLLALFWH